MKAPVCRLCGVAHYSYEQHVFAAKDVPGFVGVGGVATNILEKLATVANKKPVANVANTPSLDREGGRREVASRAVPEPSTRRYQKWREANPDLYRERQREYMRKKRAKTTAA